MPAFACAVPLELTLCLCARVELRRLPLGQPRSRQPPQRDICAIRMCMMRAHACGLVVLDSTLPALAWTLDSRSFRARSERERRLEQ